MSIFKLDQEVVVDIGDPSNILTGKIAGSPTWLANGNLAWPVELDKGLWTEGRKVFIRILMVNLDYIRPA